MPCQDVTDYISIELDSQDRLVSLRAEKVTCGKAIGRNLTLSLLSGKSAQTIWDASIYAILPEFDELIQEDQFILMKQFALIKSLLGTFLGYEDHLLPLPIEVEAISQNDSGFHLSGYAALDHITLEAIKPCGTGCGSSPKKKLVHIN